jgi:hypothetical protein
VAILAIESQTFFPMALADATFCDQETIQPLSNFSTFKGN